ncbi:MAG: S8 family serine peptidase [Crocinitomicaceae bacterium]
MKNILLITILLFSFSNSYAQNYEPNELLLQIKRNASVRLLVDELTTIAESDIVFFKQISEPMNIYHLKYSNAVDLDEIIKQTYQIESIAAIQKNHFIEYRTTIPNDTIFGSQWHLNNTGQTGGTADADIDAPEAWDISTGGNTSHGDTIVACVIEGGGVDINHIDLIGNIWKNYAEIPGNGIDDDNNGYIDDFDGWNVATDSGNISPGSHGTRVSGMLGAVGNNTTGVTGVNHKVKIMVVQGQSASNEASVIEAYSYPLVMRKKYNQTNGNEGAFVVVTNASWGINGGQPANSPLWCAMYDTLGTHGILNIGATTNSNANVDVIGDLPTTCPSPFMVGVTSSNSADFRGGTGYGPIHIDLAAPGSSVLLTNSGNNYSTSSGTSFASPCVAGAVALLYSAPCADFISYAKTFPDSAALKIKSLILDNVDVLPHLASDVGSSGRLNINNSILELVNTCNTNSCITPYGITVNNLTDTDFDASWYGLNNSGYVVDLLLGNTIVSSQTINDTVINMTGLVPCQTYELRIRGLCGTDTSNFAPSFFIQTDGCCNHPELNLVSQTETNLDLSWQSILYATNYVIRYQETGTNSWIYDTLTNTSINLNNLDTCVVYDVQIKTICTDSSRGFSDVYQYSTLGCGICYEGFYCNIVPTAVNSTAEWIESVTINGLTSTTGNNGGFYDGGVFGNGFQPGMSYIISFTPGFSGGSFTERYAVWIDMDQNGVFDPADQLISSISASGPVSGMLTIPNTSIEGITKMRIGMKGTGVPSICADEGGNIYGEYEDYCVQIGGNVGKKEYNQFTPVIYPNPTHNLFSILNVNQINTIIIYDAMGRMVYEVSSPNANQFSIEHLSNGIYTVQFSIDDKAYQSKIVKQ